MGRREHDRKEGSVMWSRGTVQHNQMADHLLTLFSTLSWCSLEYLGGPHHSYYKDEC